MIKKLTLIVVLLISTGFSAQEIDATRFNNVLKQLKYSSSQIHKELFTEKKMPNVEDSYIIVVPVLLGKLEDDGFSVKNTLLITDNSGKIKNKYIDPIEFGSDAIMLSSFTIDTGLYNLNSTIRAFGVIANYTGSSRPNPFSSSDISMYYPVEKTLKKVLDNFCIGDFRGEWDTNCAGDFEESSSIIILENGKTNNLVNLKVKTITSIINNEEVNGDCVEDKKSKTSYKTLKFNGKFYQ